VEGHARLAEAIAGLTAYKSFFRAASRASKTADEGRPTPYSVYADGNAGSIVGPAGSPAASATPTRPRPRQFVMPSHEAGKSMPGFLGGSDLAVPIGRSKDPRDRLDRRLHQHLC
jgi:N,N'-diacetylchitobiose transport system substrate-binding protein